MSELQMLTPIAVVRFDDNVAVFLDTYKGWVTLTILGTAPRSTMVEALRIMLDRPVPNLSDEDILIVPWECTNFPEDLPKDALIVMDQSLIGPDTEVFTSSLTDQDFVPEVNIIDWSA